MVLKPIVDVDDVASWPVHVAELVGGWANEHGGDTVHACDLRLPPEADIVLHKALSGCVIRAYHCTRLLDHEVQMVRERGLRPLTVDLIRDRIIAAQRVKTISATDAQCLSNAHVFATGAEQGREDQICLVLSALLFRRDPGACERLLTVWGGEGMYMSSGFDAVREQVKRMGKPTIVVALLQPASLLHVFPDLSKVFVAAALGLLDPWADVIYGDVVAPSHIESVLQPGDTAYEKLGYLPLE